MTTSRRITAALVFACACAVHVCTSYPGIDWWDGGALAVRAMVPGGLVAAGASLPGLAAQVVTAVLPWLEPARALTLAGITCSAATAALAALTVMTAVDASVLRRPAFLVGAHSTDALRERRILHVITVGGGLVAGMAVAFSDTFWTGTAVLTVANLRALLFMTFVLALTHALVGTPGTRQTSALLAAVFVAGLLTGESAVVLGILAPTAVLLLRRRHGLSLRELAWPAVIVLTLVTLLHLAVADGLARLAGPPPRDVGSHILPMLLLMAVPTLAILAAVLLRRLRRAPGMILALTAVALFLVGASISTAGRFAASAPAALRAALPVDMEFRGVGIDDGITAILSAGGWEAEAGPTVARDRTGDPLRWFFRNFVGKAGDMVGAPAMFVDAPGPGPANGAWSWNRAAFPNLLHGIPFLVGLIGIGRTIHRSMGFGMMLILAFAFTSFASFQTGIGADTGREGDAAWLPVFLLFAVFIGEGAAQLAEWLSFARRRLIPAVLMMAVVVAAVPGRMLAENWDDHDHSADWSAQDYGYNLVQSCDSAAVLITQGDNDTNPALYMTRCLGVRTDIAIIAASRLHEARTQRLLMETAGTDTLFTQMDADSLRAWDAEMREGRRTRVQRTVKAPRDLVVAALRRQFRPSPSGRVPDSAAALPAATATFTVFRSILPAQLAAFRHVQERDLAFHAILGHTVWRRPVHISLGCEPSLTAGFRSMLRLTGLTWQIAPLRYAEDAALDPDALRQHLLTRRTGMARGPERGFLLREDVPTTPEAVRFTDTYRRLLTRLVRYEALVARDPAAARVVLARIDDRVIRTGHPLTHRNHRDLAELSILAGSPERAQAHDERAIALAWEAIARDPLHADAGGNPYESLMRIHERRGEHDAMLAVLDTMAKHLPDSDIIRTTQRSIRALRDSSTLITHQ